MLLVFTQFDELISSPFFTNICPTSNIAETQHWDLNRYRRIVYLYSALCY